MEETGMSKKEENLCVLASLREPKNPAAQPALVPKLRFPELAGTEM